MFNEHDSSLPLQITAHHLSVSLQPGFQAVGVVCTVAAVQVQHAEAYQASFNLISLDNNISGDGIE